MKSRKIWLMLLIPGLLLLSPFIWTLLDRFPIISDASQYARVSVDLYHALRVSPGAWWQALLASGPFKAQGIAWFGEFFVPLGIRLGSIDRGLMLSIIVVQWATLVLLYGAVRKAGGTRLAAALSCLFLASTPRFTASGQHYMVEPLQALAAMWFLWIMVSAPRWSRMLTLSQLAGATILALLAKATSPVFSFLPGLAALWFAFRPGPEPRPWGWRDRNALLTLAAVLPVGAATLLWYIRNFQSVLMHIRYASSGPVAAFWQWGVEDTYFNTLMYWIGAMYRSLFASAIFWVPFLVLLIAALALYWKGHDSLPTDRLMFAVLLLQAALALLIFSFSPNRAARYLLPVLPIIPMLLGLVLARLGRSWLIILFLGIFSIQFFFIQGKTWRLFQGPDASMLRQIDSRGAELSLIKWVADTTCPNAGKPILNVIAAETSREAYWLAPEPVNYEIAKSFSIGINPPPCKYTYFANNYFGETAQAGWSHLLSAKVEYVVITDPDVYPPTLHTANRGLYPENQPVLMDLLDHSGRFERVGTLPGDPGILIYKRIHK